MDTLQSCICWIVLLFFSEASSTGRSLSSHRTSETNKIPWDILLDPNHRKQNQTSSSFSYHTPTNVFPSHYRISPNEHYKGLPHIQKVTFPTEAKIYPAFTNVATFRPKQKATPIPSNHYFNHQHNHDNHQDNHDNHQDNHGKRRKGDRRKPGKRKPPVESGENYFPDYDDFESVNQHNFGYPQHLIPSASDSEDYFAKAKDYVKLGSYAKPTYSSPDIPDDGFSHSFHPTDYSEEVISAYPYKNKPSKPSKYVAFALGLLPLGLLLASLVPTIVTIPVSTAVATGRRKKRSFMHKNIEEIIQLTGGKSKL